MKYQSAPLHIFKPGTHTAMSGATLAFSDTDLQASAAAYDPSRHEAPIVVGHPAHDTPAYGWVKSLAFAAGALTAEPCQVDPAFAEMVSAGRFKKISASFYAPAAPNNPVPGVFYLRHVGFLGAQPPAVKGLRAPSFGEAEEGVVEFSEFADYDDVTNASLWRSLRDWLLAKFGQDEADRVIPSYQVQSLEQAAQQEDDGAGENADDTPALQQLPPAFAEPHQPAQETSTVTPEQAAALQAENEQLKTLIQKSHADQAHKANLAFADALIESGRLLPAMQPVVVAALDHYDAQREPLEFGEGDDKKPLAAAFKDFLAKLPKVVEFGEIARNRAENVVDDGSLLADKALAYQESEARAGRTLNIAEAVQRVAAQSAV